MTAAGLARGFRQAPRTAAKERECLDCGTVIARGDRYLDYTATPRHDDNHTGKWLHAAFCARCAEGAPEWRPHQEPSPARTGPEQE
jgi:hypothetical protein